MPILLQEVRRRPPLRRKRFLGVLPVYLVYAAVCSGILAGWLFRPGGGLLPTRTAATIRIMPAAVPEQRTHTARQAQAKPREASQRVSVPSQPKLDRDPVGTIKAPRAAATGFSDVQRAAPENYTGFREVTQQR
ncbi:hypothetical protein PY365_18170 [Roseiarcaceae bacterium H3SJ34-1]|uniref:hypothetical protein n=1 Tax=Terripilifer ovatus TaxID=3032367 RepID=UPI003AB9767F|nr:hypothetical protein [Roseiarcaceae bacterium H3SJ34-1]